MLLRTCHASPLLCGDIEKRKKDKTTTNEKKNYYDRYHRLTTQLLLRRSVWCARERYNIFYFIRMSEINSKTLHCIIRNKFRNHTETWCETKRIVKYLQCGTTLGKHGEKSFILCRLERGLRLEKIWIRIRIRISIRQ